MAGFSLGNVMEIFRGAGSGSMQSQQLNQPGMQQQGQQQQAQQFQQPNQQSNNPQGNKQLEQKEQSPEELFKDFWNIDPKKDAVPENLGEFNFNFDPKKVDQTVQGMDFTRAISPDIVKKIAAGGEEAVTAMLTAMNTVGQQVMRNAVIAGAKVTETGLRTSGERITNNLPHLVRQHTVSNALREDNPLFTDPTTAPVLAAFEQQAAIKFPNATPQEIKDYARQYMTNFVQKGAQYVGMEVNQATKKPSQKQSNIQYDWDQEPV